MPKSVLLIVGHQNIANITKEGLRSWRDANALRASTGGTGEANFNWNDVMPKLRDLLIAKGLQVFITDAIYHKDTYSREYDVAIALHDDGGNTNNRSMSSAPLVGATPAYLNAPAQAEAERFARVWNKTYPAKTGTINNDGAVTAGMREYYMFDYIGSDTPMIIVEQFNRDSPKGKELRQNPTLVAQGNADAILEFLGISNTPPPASGQELENAKKEIVRLNGIIASQTETIKNQFELEQVLRGKIEKAKQDLS